VEALQTQFHRFKDEVLRDVGITNEEVSLSGFPDEPNEFVTLMLNMAEEILTKKPEAKAIKEKKEQKNNTMLNLEEEVLKRGNDIQKKSKEEIDMTMFKTPSSDGSPFALTTPGNSVEMREKKKEKKMD
jgi:hypothetical protein